MFEYLIISEKNTLAKSIASVFAKNRRKNGYYEASDSSLGTAHIYYTFGHILETDVRKTLAKVGYSHSIPVFPESFVMTPRANRADLFKQISSVIKLESSNRTSRMFLLGDLNVITKLLSEVRDKN